MNCVERRIGDFGRPVSRRRDFAERRTRRSDPLARAPVGSFSPAPAKPRRRAVSCRSLSHRPSEGDATWVPRSESDEPASGLPRRGRAIEGCWVFGVGRRQPAPTAKSIRRRRRCREAGCKRYRAGLLADMSGCSPARVLIPDYGVFGHRHHIELFVAVHVGHGHRVADFTDMRVDLLRFEVRWVGPWRPLKRKTRGCDMHAMRSRCMKRSPIGS